MKKLDLKTIIYINIVFVCLTIAFYQYIGILFCLLSLLFNFIILCKVNKDEKKES